MIAFYILGRNIGAHHPHLWLDQWLSADILLGADDSVELSAGSRYKHRRRRGPGVRRSHADTDPPRRRSVTNFIGKYIGYQFLLYSFPLSPSREHHTVRLHTDTPPYRHPYCAEGAMQLTPYRTPTLIGFLSVGLHTTPLLQLCRGYHSVGFHTGPDLIGFTFSGAPYSPPTPTVQRVPYSRAPYPPPSPIELIVHFLIPYWRRSGTMTLC